MSTSSAGGPRRAVVTGIGVLSPVGNGRAELEEAVLAGRSGIDRIRSFDPSPFRTPFGGELDGFDPAERLSDEEIESFGDRYLQYALHAAREALEDAGLEWSRARRPGPRAGLVVGTCNGGLLSAQRQYEVLCGKKRGSFDRVVALLIRYHALGKALTYGLGVTGPTWITTTACSSSTAALALARELVSQDEVDVVLAGGADAMCLATMAGFDALKATSGGRIAPFSEPVGLNLGEGAAFWVVEELGAAERRGADVQGEIRGYAFTSDAHHPTAPDPRGGGAMRTMNEALERSGTAPHELGCYNLHGTGTAANDPAESRAVGRVQGEARVPAHSFKSQVGHCLGAAGILEATAGLLAMRAGAIPATINFGEPRPGCSLDYVPNRPRAARYDRFLSCNYAFGGHNAAVVIGLPDAARPPAAEPRPEAVTVLTGAGAVTSLGLGAGRLLAALREGRRGLSPAADRVEGSTRSRLGGWVRGFADREVDRRLDTRSMNPISRLATAAARLAMADAGLRPGPREAERTGLINGVYVGPSEESHMTAVMSSGGAAADIAGFSSIVANATAGWASAALMLKGYALTVSQGADAGLFALLAAHMALRSGFGPRIIAGAADELYSRYYLNYDELGLLHTGEYESRYRIAPDIDDRRVLGEGAAYVVAEDRDAALRRGARPLAEVCGAGQAMEIDTFLDPIESTAGLETAILRALETADWEPGEVELVSWSPQGNRRDLRVTAALERALGPHGREVPLVTSVFHTGLAESASGSATLAALLAAWCDGGQPWPQITGLEEIDERPLPRGPVKTLLLATSELGYNLALALAPAREESR
ncbi:MAG: beta-ketoacyl-[acyl-carrier-protein] synthase family protein [Polyangia bacterium]